jgi:hypothetical protein
MIDGQMKAYLDPQDAMGTIIHYLPQLKGTTIMVDGSRPQAPYISLTKEEYLEQSGEFDLFLDSLDENCQTGACPVK